MFNDCNFKLVYAFLAVDCAKLWEQGRVSHYDALNITAYWAALSNECKRF